MLGSVWITSGLPMPKNVAQTPTAGGSAFITSGLPAEVLVAAAGNRRRRVLICGRRRA